MQGASETALVASLIPELTLGSKDGRFTLDLGAGGALISRHRFGTQDYGGPFQFALTLAAAFRSIKNSGWATGFCTIPMQALMALTRSGQIFT